MSSKETRLEDLIPIAVVIAAGCEPCAERMVRRALESGAPQRDVRKVLGIVSALGRQECFAKAVGTDAVARMERPLERGKKTLSDHVADTPRRESIVEKVRSRYGEIAKNSPTVPGLGCGAPIDSLELQPGETVLDLGSGGGLDATRAAEKVGSTGSVIGVDMTPEMLQRARENASRAGLDHVEFREGRLEQLPVADASVDAVTSNCVVNLVPDKKKVFDEIARVLKPGGRLVISDIVLDGPLPDAITRSVLAHVGCVAGALPKDEYFSHVRQAGLEHVEIIEEIDASRLAEEFMTDELGRLLSDAGVRIEDLRGRVLSVTFRAEKSVNSEPASAPDYQPRQKSRETTCCGLTPRR